LELKGNYIIIFLITLIFCFNLTAFAESESITVTGRAYVEDGNLESAYESALNNGLRTAVEKVVGTYIDAETRVENMVLIEDNILKSTKGYIKEYSIIDETLEDNHYLLKLKAEVSTKDLSDDLKALEFNIKRYGNPRLAVIVEQELVATELQSHLLKAGYLLVDPNIIQENLSHQKKKAIIAGDYDLAADIASSLEADIIISGNVETDAIDLSDKFSDGFGSGIISAQTTISLRAINASNGEIITAVNTNDKAVGISEQSARNDALLAATDEISTLLVEDISQDLIIDDKSIRLEISNLETANKINQLESALSELDDVIMTYFREYRANSASFDLEIKNEVRLLNLAAQLDEILDFDLEVNNIAENRIRMKVKD